MGGRRRLYFVPVPLGVEGEPLGDELEGEPLGDELGGVLGVLGDVDEGGDAEGERSPGRSAVGPPVGDSLQAVSTPTLSARTQRPVSILFMSRRLLL
jgi:hypothetical protein